MEFYTYRGASAIDRSILDWHLCRVAILELLAQPHISIPHVHVGFIATLYTRTLFSSDNGDFMQLVGTDIVQSICNTECVQRKTYTHRVRKYPGHKNSAVVPRGHAN